MRRILSESSISSPYSIGSQPRSEPRSVRRDVDALSRCAYFHMNDVARQRYF